MINLMIQIPTIKKHSNRNNGDRGQNGQGASQNSEHPRNKSSFSQSGEVHRHVCCRIWDHVLNHCSKNNDIARNKWFYKPTREIDDENFTTEVKDLSLRNKNSKSRNVNESENSE